MRERNVRRAARNESCPLDEIRRPAATKATPLHEVNRAVTKSTPSSQSQPCRRKINPAVKVGHAAEASSGSGAAQFRRCAGLEPLDPPEKRRNFLARPGFAKRGGVPVRPYI
jgi:hypothetical protein